MWIDNHTHINMLEDGVVQSIDQAILDAKNVGIERLINIGTHPDDLELVYQTTQKYFPNVLCTLGLHPHEAKFYDEKIESTIMTLAKNKEVIGIGEIGLDFFYNHSDHDVQKKVFIRQMEMAEQLDLPVEIHTRDAEKETIEVLKMFKKVKGAIHCFSGSQWLADESLAIGYNISISGIVTFKKADVLQNIVKNLPLDRIHVETDAPFLAPVPMRGKKNVPAYLIHTAEFVAKLKGVSNEELQKAIWKNTTQMFAKFI